MKKIYLLSILILTSAIVSAQWLTEITDINIYEHHFSGCDPCAPSTLGDSSAYDFVTHQHINAVGPNAFDVNRDLIEHNGDAWSPAPFGFTSDSSSVWAGTFGGNGTTKYVLASGFDYANATEASVVNAYNNGNASTDVDVVQVGEVYIGKIRDLDYYVVLVITGYQTNTDNDFTFDYKYTDNPIATAAIDENDQVSSLSVYPNPTNGKIGLQLDKTYQDISISIVNQYGAQIFFGQFNNQNLINLNVETLSNGIYYIVSKADGQITQQKFVKEN